MYCEAARQLIGSTVVGWLYFTEMGEFSQIVIEKRIVADPRFPTHESRLLEHPFGRPYLRLEKPTVVRSRWVPARSGLHGARLIPACND